MLKPRFSIDAGDMTGASARMVASALDPGSASIKGGYEAAQMKRRLIAWKPPSSHVNAILAYSGDTLRARARDLGRNNGYAANAADTFVANLIGAGIKPSPLVSDAKLKKSIAQTWLDWTDEADADGLTDFYGLQALAAREMFSAGEYFFRLRYRRAEDGLTVPLQLQGLPAEMLPLEKTETLPNGNMIRCGIEFDRIGRRVAYWFFRRHPNDATDPSFAAGDIWTRVPADEVIHLRRWREGGQIRGEPWITPAMAKLYHLDAYDDAELDRKKIAALFAGFITRKDSQEPIVAGEEDDGEGTGTAVAPLQPGQIQVLDDGEDIKFSEPAESGASYEPFQFRTLLQVSAALGVPYANLSNDLKSANYSSLRAGLVEFRRRLEQVQHSVIVFQLCRPVYQAWLAQAALSGAISMPGFRRNARDYMRAKWIPPKFEWVDPKKDLDAEVVAVQNGFKARSDVIEGSGSDPEETDDRIAADKEREKGMGLDFSVAATTGKVPAAAPAAEMPADQPAAQGFGEIKIKGLKGEDAPAIEQAKIVDGRLQMVRSDGRTIDAGPLQLDPATEQAIAAKVREGVAVEQMDRTNTLIESVVNRVDAQGAQLEQQGTLLSTLTSHLMGGFRSVISAVTAPKRIVRDEKSGKPLGIETVGDQTPR